MDINEIKEIIRLMQETDIIELHLEKNESKIRLKRERVPAYFEPPHIQSTKKQPYSHHITEKEESNIFTVISPIVGIFYRASAPDAEPFVDVGDRVKKGQILCIIEAMKLMNEIESEVDGVIVETAMGNGQSVEYGSTLFTIETD